MGTLVAVHLFGGKGKSWFVWKMSRSGLEFSVFIISMTKKRLKVLTVRNKKYKYFAHLKATPF